MKLTDKETYQATLEYGKYKASLKFWKILLLGFMGGAFVALGYVGAFAMKSLEDNGMMKFLGAAIFPTGILMCVFLGGSLFTSDNLSMLPALEKQIKPITALKGWGLVWVGNMAGGLFIAVLAYASGFFQGGHVPKFEILQHYIDGKQNKEWWRIFFSGVLTNVLVAGSVWMSCSTKSVSGKVALLWFPITLFAAAGFEHIVANFFIFWSGILCDGSTYKVGNLNETVHIDAWKFFYNNLIFTTLGNWVGGAVVVTMPYYFLNKGK